MDIAQLETSLISLLKGEFTSLSIGCNEHKANYLNAADAAAQLPWMQDSDWVSDEERSRSFATNTIWHIQWYPETPIGSYSLYASSLPALLAAVIGKS